MIEVNVTVPVNASGEKVWEVLADFSGFLKWAGGGEGEITIEGEGIGMVRHLKMAVGDLAERLILLDAGERKLGYELVYGEPLGMKQYKALVQVIDVGTACEILWKGELETGSAETEAQVGEALKSAYQGMTQALVSYLES